MAIGRGGAGFCLPRPRPRNVLRPPDPAPIPDGEYYLLPDPAPNGERVPRPRTCKSTTTMLCKPLKKARTNNNSSKEGTHSKSITTIMQCSSENHTLQTKNGYSKINKKWVGRGIFPNSWHAIISNMLVCANWRKKGSTIQLNQTRAANKGMFTIKLKGWGLLRWIV